MHRHNSKVEKHYTGIGSRETPQAIQDLMRRIAARLRLRGYVLRSGAADGADRAFETGTRDAAEIYLPWPGFNGSTSSLHALPTAAQAAELAATVHPRWSSLKPAVQKLHARNCFQVLGATLDCPSEFVVCWTADGAQTEQERSAKTGGTGTAIVLAARRGIPVINLARPDAMDRLAKLVLKEQP